MIRGLYAIWDIKANDIVADVITLHRHDGTAARMFTDALGGKGDLANHPADYKLLCLGTLSTSDGPHDDAPPEFSAVQQRTVYTGQEWLEATRARPADPKPALTFPGMPASDR